MEYFVSGDTDISRTLEEFSAVSTVKSGKHIVA